MRYAAKETAWMFIYFILFFLAWMFINQECLLTKELIKKEQFLYFN